MNQLDTNTLVLQLKNLRKAYYWDGHLILEGEPSLREQFQQYLKTNNLRLDLRKVIVRNSQAVPVLSEQAGVVKFYDPLSRKVKVYVRNDVVWTSNLDSGHQVERISSRVWYQVLRILKSNEALKKEQLSKVVDLRLKSHPKYCTLEFCGAARQVGASCFLVQTDQQKILLDSGVGFGSEKEPTLNLDPSEIDYVVLSHSHSDHSMYIPVLVKRGFKGKILATKATLLTYYVLGKEALSIEKNQALFDLKDLQRSLSYFEILEVGEKKDLSEVLTVEFFHANHTLGSVMVDLSIRKSSKEHHRLLYTGDYKNDFQEKEPFYKRINLDRRYHTVITEGTYGGTDQRSRVETQLPRVKELLDKFKTGAVLIPVFSNRAVQLLYHLSEVLEQESWNRIRISNSVLSFFELTLDCPESVEAHTYSRLLQLWPKVKLLPIIGQDFVEPNAIYVTPSGMMQGGSSSKLVLDLASDERNLILFTGFLSKNTLGATLLETPSKGYFTVSRNNLDQKVLLNAQKDLTRFMSAHSNFVQIQEFILRTTFKSSKVYLVHGSEDALLEVKMGFKKNPKITGHVKVPYGRTRDRLF